MPLRITGISLEAICALSSVGRATLSYGEGQWFETIRVHMGKMDEIEFEKFIKWMNENCMSKETHVGFTLSEHGFVKQMFELFEDYPSFKNKISEMGSKVKPFDYIQRYLKETK